MSFLNLKEHFSHFLGAGPDRLHFAAHSHHLWPDVTLEAQERCWRDAARLADRKWGYIFSELYPETQAQVAALLSLPDPTTLAFGPNTHAFLLRLLSCLPANKPPKILTSDSEFHSFERQLSRLEEEKLFKVLRVPTEPFDSFTERFGEAAEQGGYDLIYVSQVFYNSGFVLKDLSILLKAITDHETLVVIDGYHGFMALETDLSAIADRAFYLAGGYKYAMSGEGVCFLHCPPGCGQRPRDTGWYAAFDALETGAANTVPYSNSGSRFLGATFDPVGLYRLNAVLGWLETLDLNVADIHRHVHELQRVFIEGLRSLGKEALRPERLVVSLSQESRGNFLTFRSDMAGELHQQLLTANIVTDYRGDRLRFGFGLYHERQDLDRLLDRLDDVIG